MISKKEITSREYQEGRQWEVSIISSIEGICVCKYSMTSYVRYYHRKNRTSGHIWQGRYKSFIVEKECYYLILIRYIEANALRARLVNKAEELEYGSLYIKSSLSPFPHTGENIITNIGQVSSSKSGVHIVPARPDQY